MIIVRESSAENSPVRLDRYAIGVKAPEKLTKIMSSTKALARDRSPTILSPL